MSIEFVPIKEKLEENRELAKNAACTPTLNQCIEFYTKAGFVEPWICYYGLENGEVVANAAFKGEPRDGAVEIAYGTMEQYQRKGIGTRVCRQLVQMALAQDPALRITARTLPERNFSTRILEKNDFRLLGTVDDPEDGAVWEWEYTGNLQ